MINSHSGKLKLINNIKTFDDWVKSCFIFCMKERLICSLLNKNILCESNRRNVYIYQVSSFHTFALVNHRYIVYETTMNKLSGQVKLF